MSHGLRLARLVMRDAFPRWSKAAAPSWVLLLLAAVQADAVVDWGALASHVAALPLLVRGGLATALAALWAYVGAQPLRVALRASCDRWRWRLPLSAVDQAVGLTPLWACAMAPAVAVGWLVGVPLALPAAALLPTVALACGRWGVAALGVAFAAAVLVLAQSLPLGLVAWPVAAWLGARVLAVSPPPAGEAGTKTGVRPWGAASALWLRDLLALWRLQRGLVLGPLLVSAPAWAVQHTAVSHYPLHGESAVRGGLLVLSLATAYAAGAVLALPQCLGPALDPRRAPMSAGARAAWMASVGGALAMPCVIAVLLGGSGAPWRVVLHAAAMVSGAAWFAVGLGRRTDSDRSSFLWWVMALCALAFAPVPWGPLAVAALAVVAWWGTTTTLTRARRLP